MWKWFKLEMSGVWGLVCVGASLSRLSIGSLPEVTTEVQDLSMLVEGLEV